MRTIFIIFFFVFSVFGLFAEKPDAMVAQIDSKGIILANKQLKVEFPLSDEGKFDRFLIYSQGEDGWMLMGSSHPLSVVSYQASDGNVYKLAARPTSYKVTSGDRFPTSVTFDQT